MKKMYTTKPKLKAYDPQQGETSFIFFEESIDVPGLEKADIRIELEKNNSVEEMRELATRLNKSGFTFSVRK